MNASLVCHERIDEPLSGFDALVLSNQVPLHLWNSETSVGWYALWINDRLVGYDEVERKFSDFKEEFEKIYNSLSTMEEKDAALNQLRYHPWYLECYSHEDYEPGWVTLDTFSKTVAFVFAKTIDPETPIPWNPSGIMNQKANERFSIMAICDLAYLRERCGDTTLDEYRKDFLKERNAIVKTIRDSRIIVKKYEILRQEFTHYINQKLQEISAEWNGLVKYYPTSVDLSYRERSNKKTLLRNVMYSKAKKLLTATTSLQL